MKKTMKVREMAEKLTDEDMNYLAGIWSYDDLMELSLGRYATVFKKAAMHPRLLKMLKYLR